MVYLVAIPNFCRVDILTLLGRASMATTMEIPSSDAFQHKLRVLSRLVVRTQKEYLHTWARERHGEAEIGDVRTAARNYKAALTRLSEFVSNAHSEASFLSEPLS